MSDRRTASRHSPVVGAAGGPLAATTWSVSREGRLGVERPRVRGGATGARSGRTGPAALPRRSNSATVLRSSPCSSTAVRRWSMSGPAIAEIPPSVLSDPRDDRPVVEPDDQLHPHRRPGRGGPRRSGRGPAPRSAERHEVDHRDRPVVGLERRSRAPASVPVAAADRPDLAGRGEEPAAVLGGPEQGGEAGARVEPREAEPVDRPVACRRGPPSGSRRSGRSPRSGRAWATPCSSIAATPGGPRALEPADRDNPRESISRSNERPGPGTTAIDG